MERSGRAALITGGKRIGAAVARAFAAAGMDVALSYNTSRAEADAAAADIVFAGRRAYVARANLATPEECRALVEGAAVPHMRRAGGGRIINFADWVAASGRPRYQGYLPYYVAKAGTIALTEALALELAADNILVNAIAPGPIMAPPDTSEEERRAVEAATPLGRWGGPDAIVRAAIFLLETDFVTGETIRVDGGRHVK